MGEYHEHVFESTAKTTYFSLFNTSATPQERKVLKCTRDKVERTFTLKTSHKGLEYGTMEHGRTVGSYEVDSSTGRTEKKERLVLRKSENRKIENQHTG